MLTHTQCRNAKPKDKPYKLPDGQGLYLEVKPNGVKAWRYRFDLREGGIIKESLFALGDYVVAAGLGGHTCLRIAPASPASQDRPFHWHHSDQTGPVSLPYPAPARRHRMPARASI
jgi:hypothetical protein